MVNTREVRKRAVGAERNKEVGLEGGDGGVTVRREEDVKGVNERWRTPQGSMKDRGKDEG